ncbi:TorF family putative porin [Lysobacter brunescens]|uniref:TorF family putative porin n=1 Tax=Lysobacter brunescens TaxID=262323 RepID=A0ABW2YBJ0_9GAMM
MIPVSKRLREARAPLITAILAAIGLMAIGREASAVDLTGNAAIGTDYVWRGTTQTQGDPTVQAGVKVAGESGLYASIWASNVEFAPETRASSELDFTVGWTKALNDDWTVDVNAVRYQYPSTTVDLDWTELNGTITYRSHYWLSLGYSSEALGYDADGTYALLGAKLPVTDTFRFEAAVGHYFLDDAVVAKDGYSHGLVSAVWAFKAPFEARLTAHATDSNAKTIFGDDVAGSRVEAALQASF